MKNNVLGILICLFLLACSKRNEIKKATTDEDDKVSSSSRINDSSKDILLGVILKGYQPKYLEENKFKLKVVKANKMDYFTTKGMNIHFELSELIRQAGSSADNELDDINAKIQQKLSQTVDLPDYQRLVAGTATRFMGSRLLRSASNTPKEKELILFYTRSFIAQQGTNYYLIYTALKRLEGYTTSEEIKSLAQTTIAVNATLDVNEQATEAQKYQKAFNDKIIEGERYNQLYRVKLQEFL